MAITVTVLLHNFEACVKRHQNIPAFSALAYSIRVKKTNVFCFFKKVLSVMGGRYVTSYDFR